MGSSASSSAGALASARAMATRCCSPPESSAGRCSARSRKPEPSSSSVRPLGGLRARRAGDHLRHRDVLERREFRQQMVVLVDEAHAVAAERRARVVVERGAVLAADPDLAAVGLLEQAGDVQQRRFAGNRRGRRARPVRRAARTARPAQHLEPGGALFEAALDVLEDEALSPRSLIAQGLHRIEPRRPPGRIERRREGEPSAIATTSATWLNSTMAGSRDRKSTTPANGRSYLMRASQPPMRSMLPATARPSATPRIVPNMPVLAPLRKKMRMIAARVAPMVRRIAISRPLSFTSITWPETMLKAATSMISASRMKVTMRSTFSAERRPN